MDTYNMKKQLLLGLSLLFSVIFLIQYGHSEQSPNWLWARKPGGISNHEPNSILLDKFGNVYLSGGYDDTIAFDSFILTKQHSRYATFLAKYDTYGNVIWAKETIGHTSTLDSAGYLYGGTANTLVKYDPSGNVLWTQTIFVDPIAWVSAMVIDSGGNIYVGGYFQGKELRIGQHLLRNEASDRTMDCFYAKYDKERRLLWAKKIGGPKDDKIGSIALDKLGNLYLFGDFGSPSISLESVTLNSGRLFVAKCDSNGNILWAKAYGGEDTSFKSAQMDILGNVYLLGGFYMRSASFDSYILTNESIGSVKSFIVKCDPSGKVIWAKSIEERVCNSFKLDRSANIYIAGAIVPPRSSVAGMVVTRRDREICISKYDANGNRVWMKSAQGFGFFDDWASDLEVDDNHNVYVTGKYYSPGLDFGISKLERENSKDQLYDLFIAKVGEVK
jgi:hypothetical protein